MNKLIELYNKLIGRGTVEGILGAFHRSVANLEALAAKHTKDIVEHDKAIAKAALKKLNSTQEIQAAQTAVANIRSLIGIKPE